MAKKNYIIILLDKKWIGKFFQNRFAQYFHGAKKLIDFDIEVIKIFLNHQRLIARYNLILSGRNGIFKKTIIVKAEKKIGFFGKPAGTKTDYSTNIFLREQKLDNLVPRPLEYYQPLLAFFYEAIEGVCLRQLSINRHSQEFMDFIPIVAEAVQKIHCLKNNKIIVNGQHWENKQHKFYLFLVKKYYPFGFNHFKNLIQACRDFKIKNKNYFRSRFQSLRLTHGDLHSGNIFIVNENIKLLDFSDASASDPLSDLGCFFIHTELMFEHDFHQNYKEMTDKMKLLFCRNYFNRDLSDSDKKIIYYYMLSNLCRIISYASMDGNKHKETMEANDLLEKLIKIGEEKIKTSY